MEFKTNRLNKIGEDIYTSLNNIETLCQGVQEIEELQESSLQILDENLKNLKALKKKYDEELASGFFLDAKNYLEEMSYFDNSDEQLTDNFISAFANEVDKQLKAEGINTNIDEDTFCEFANQVNSNWREWIINYPAAEDEINTLYQMQGSDKLNIKEFSPLMQLLYDRCIWNDANMGFIEYDELPDYGFTDQDVNNLLKEADQFNLPISLEMSGDMPYLCGYQSLIKYFDNETVEEKPKMPELEKTDEGRKLSQAEELTKSSQSKDKE